MFFNSLPPCVEQLDKNKQKCRSRNNIQKIQLVLDFAVKISGPPLIVEQLMWLHTDHVSGNAGDTLHSFNYGLNI